MTNSLVRFKKSSVSGKAPSLGDLSLGEIAINYYDGSIFAIQDTAGVGIATTVTNLTPWTENYGGTGIEYTGDINVVGVSTFDDVSIGGTLSLSGAGSQFFAFNEDTVKVKFANWYSTNTRQYGMGQLWYETWFAAIDDQGQNQNRRIGFYLDLPDRGASDASGGTGAHPTNDAMHIDLNGVGIAGTVDMSGELNVAGIVTLSSLNEGGIVAVGAGNTLITNTALNLDTTNNRLGIGTANPEVKFHIVGEAPNEAQFRLVQYNNTADAPDIRTRRGRGTQASPSNLQTNDYVFRLNVEGYQGGVETYSSVQFDVDGTDADALNFKLQTRDTAGTLATRYSIDGSGDSDITGDLSVSGALSKGSGTFTIPHPIAPETHKLVHSFVEGPLCDLIYRGKAKLQSGKATINMNEYFGMMEGTFEALVDDTDVFITNNNSWDPVRGKIEGAVLTIECKNVKSATTVSWLVVGDRKDDNIKEAKWTDGEGKPILEPPIKGIIQKSILNP